MKTKTSQTARCTANGMTITLTTMTPNRKERFLVEFPLPQGTTRQTASRKCGSISNGCPSVNVYLKMGDAELGIWRATIPTIQVKVYDIEWDDAPKHAKLPKSMVVKVELTEAMSGDEINQRATDLASDEYGYCICSCRHDIMLESIMPFLTL